MKHQELVQKVIAGFPVSEMRDSATAAAEQGDYKSVVEIINELFVVHEGEDIIEESLWFGRDFTKQQRERHANRMCKVMKEQGRAFSPVAYSEETGLNWMYLFDALIEFKGWESLSLHRK